MNTGRQVLRKWTLRSAKHCESGYPQGRADSINTRRKALKKSIGQLSQKKYLNANESYISWYKSVLSNSVKTQNL